MAPKLRLKTKVQARRECDTIFAFQHVVVRPSIMVVLRQKKNNAVAPIVLYGTDLL
jgi:hypothetical protein